MARSIARCLPIATSHVIWDSPAALVPPIYRDAGRTAGRRAARVDRASGAFYFGAIKCVNISHAGCGMTLVVFLSTPYWNLFCHSGMNGESLIRFFITST